MISVTPQGQVYLCKTPLENDYKNQLTFSNKTSQLNYFNSTIQKSFNQYTYIKENNVIRVSENIDKIRSCNYLFYRNNGFVDENGNVKVFYCFITNMTYISENATAITFETDVFQTWQFEIQYKRCFIEREHVNDDTIGIHTIPENLETGDYVSIGNTKVTMINNPSDFYICMGVTELPDESVPAYSNHRTYNGVFGGLYYLAFTTPANCENAIKIYDKVGKADAINCLFMIPKTMSSITDGESHTWTVNNISCTLIYLNGSDEADTIGNLTATQPSTLANNYTPKNNKLFTYPFSFMNFTNNSGNVTPFRYEDFDIDEITHQRAIGFWIDACITPGMSMKAIPLFYKNININYGYGVMGGKLPVCSWNSDVYLNWLTQNGLNVALDVAGGLVGTATGIASGNVGGALSGITGIFNALHQVYIADLTPNQAKGNTNSGDVNFSETNDGGFTLYYMSIKPEYAKVIDDYFSMFGYKINEVKYPNITGRTNWNYVKTIDCNFDGDIPQSDLNIIKSMFNNGVTLWHSPASIYNYALNNNIV